MKKMSAVLKILAILAAIALMLWFNQTYLQWTPTDIRTWILLFGWLAPFLFVVLYTVRPLILFPASILSLTGGLAFGALWGTVLTVIGATAGAVLSFAAARYLGRSLVRKGWTGNMNKVQLQLEKRGLLYVLLLRLIPLFPFDLISYVSGVSKIRFRGFFIGTLFGIIPGTFAYNFLGSSLAEGRLQDILIAAAVFLAALAIPILFRKRWAGDIK
jgi:uncharacterized membrane protein YdjX (TVP38/TMEM64 family)